MQRSVGERTRGEADLSSSLLLDELITVGKYEVCIVVFLDICSGAAIYLSLIIEPFHRVHDQGCCPIFILPPALTD